MDIYTVIRTSRDTADAQAVVLRETNTTRLVFKPSLVNNARDANAPLAGAFVFQKKRQNDEWEDYNEVPLSRLRAEEWIKLELRAGEVHQLLGHLAGLYRLYHKGGLRRGKTHFLKLVTQEEGAEELVQVDLARLLDTISRTGVHVVTRLLEWMSNLENAPEILDQLERLEIDSLRQINSLVGITNLKALYHLWEENQTNMHEEFWQQTFQKHFFALTQVFAFPVVLFREKAYVGGKRLENTGGNLVDFLAANHLTRNAVLVEIKTPGTPLLRREYRSGGIYGASDDLAGGVAQVLSYRHTLQREFDSIGREYRDQVEAFSPHCMVILGHAREQLRDPGRMRSFELFRNAVSSEVTILAYDELFEKVRGLLEILEGSTVTDGGRPSVA